MKANKYFSQILILTSSLIFFGTSILPETKDFSNDQSHKIKKIEIISLEYAKSSAVCWPVWEVKITGEIEFALSEIFPIPIPILKEHVTCNPGGNFTCPLEACEDLIFNE